MKYQLTEGSLDQTTLVCLSNPRNFGKTWMNVAPKASTSTVSPRCSNRFRKVHVQHQNHQVHSIAQEQVSVVSVSSLFFRCSHAAVLSESRKLAASLALTNTPPHAPLVTFHVLVVTTLGAWALRKTHNRCQCTMPLRVSLVRSLSMNGATIAREILLEEPRTDLDSPADKNGRRLVATDWQFTSLARIVRDGAG